MNECIIRVSRRVPQVNQGILLNTLVHPVFIFLSGSCCSIFSFIYSVLYIIVFPFVFFLWPFHCVSFFDLQLLNIPMVLCNIPMVPCNIPMVFCNIPMVFCQTCLTQSKTQKSKQINFIPLFSICRNVDVARKSLSHERYLCCIR